MSKLVSFLRLPVAEKRLIIKALFLVWAVSLGLCILPLSRLRKLIAKTPNIEIDSSFSVKQLIWSVDAASRCVPVAKCLARAMAAQVLLAEHGHRSELCIGVAKVESQLKAHAWLEDEGKVLIGGSVCDYKPLPLDNL